MKNILIATDLSERSNRALRRAAMLAAQFGAHLTVLHVTDADLPERVATAVGTEAEQAIREQLDRSPSGLAPTGSPSRSWRATPSPRS